MGGRLHPNVRLDALGPTQAYVLPLLEDSQQRLHLADLVQQQRAALRLIEPAHFAGCRARERATLVAEQLGLEQIIGKSCTIDGDERPR